MDRAVDSPVITGRLSAHRHCTGAIGLKTRTRRWRWMPRPCQPTPMTHSANAAPSEKRAQESHGRFELQALTVDVDGFCPHTRRAPCGLHLGAPPQARRRDAPKHRNIVCRRPPQGLMGRDSPPCPWKYYVHASIFSCGGIWGLDGAEGRPLPSCASLKQIGPNACAHHAREWVGLAAGGELSVKQIHHVCA